MPSRPTSTTRRTADGRSRLMLIVVGIVLLFVLPAPWNWICFGAGLLLGAGEVFLWNRKVRGLPVRAGAETLIGESAVVVTPGRTDGQVELRGAVWAARSETELPAGAAADDRSPEHRHLFVDVQAFDVVECPLRVLGVVIRRHDQRVLAGVRPRLVLVERLHVDRIGACAEPPPLARTG